MTLNIPDIIAIGALALPAFGYIIHVERKISALSTDVAWIKHALQEKNPEDD